MPIVQDVSGSIVNRRRGRHGNRCGSQATRIDSIEQELPTNLKSSDNHFFQFLVESVRAVACAIGYSSRAGVWLIFGPMIGTRMSHEPPKMCLTPYKRGQRIGNP